MSRFAGSAHPSVAPVAPSWVVTLSMHGVEKGMVGPFPDVASAEAWAAEAVQASGVAGVAGVVRGWSWRCEPVVSPAALPHARSAGSGGGPGEGSGRRRHLAVVR